MAVGRDHADRAAGARPSIFRRLLTLVVIVFLAAARSLSLRFTRRGVRSGIAIVDAMDDSAGSGFRLHAGLKAALAQGTVAGVPR